MSGATRPADSIDVLVPGRPTVDLLFSALEAWPRLGGEVYAGQFGVAAGAHFNTAAALRRLGLRVAFAAVVGDDAQGELVLRELRDEGLEDDFVRVERDVPTPVSAVLGHADDRGFVTFGPAHERAERAFVDTALELLGSRPVRHVHADLSAARQLVGPARRAGATLSVDAHDAGAWLSSAEAREVVSSVDLLFGNEDEARGMTGAPTAEDAARALAARCRHVVLKRGARGAAAFLEGRRLDAPPAAAVVVDATGAGDCFAAGYLWGWLRGDPPEACLAYANACGAAAVGSLGGYRGAPTAAELLARAGGPAQPG